MRHEDSLPMDGRRIPHARWWLAEGAGLTDVAVCRSSHTVVCYTTAHCDDAAMHNHGIDEALDIKDGTCLFVVRTGPDSCQRRAERLKIQYPQRESRRASRFQECLHSRSHRGSSTANPLLL